MQQHSINVRASSDPPDFGLIETQSGIDQLPPSVAEVVKSAPPLTPDAVDQLRHLLPGLGRRPAAGQTVRGAA